MEAGPRLLRADEFVLFDFTLVGDGRSALGAGWSHQETGFIWTAAVRSEVRLPRLCVPTENIGLSVYLHPILSPPHCTAQRFWIELGGARSYEVKLVAPGWLNIIFPASLFGESQTLLEFNQPDAIRPADFGHPDTRLLGVAIESLAAWPAPTDMTDSARGKLHAELESRRLKLSEKELLKQFESLGSNCEFGVLQQSFDLEQVRLLRFAYTPYHSLLAALKEKFRGMGAAETLSIEPAREGAEYMIQDTRFGIRYHSQIRSDQISPDQLLTREVGRIGFLRRQLLDLLESGGSIFVYVTDLFLGDPPLGSEHAIGLANELNAYGNNTLLWVVLAASPAEAGEIEVLRPGLIIGYVEKLCDPRSPPMLVSAKSWLSVCSRACAAWAQWKTEITQPERAAPVTPPAPEPVAARTVELSPSWRILTGAEVTTETETHPASEARLGWRGRLGALFRRFGEN